MTLKQWFSDAATVALWRDTFEMPHMRVGFEILREVALPTAVVVPAGVDLVQWGAITNARREGFVMALRLIHRMGKVPEGGLEPEDVDQGWGAVDLNHPPESISRKK